MTPLPDPGPEARRGMDIRPVVVRRGRDVPAWLIAVFAVIGAVLLFLVLDGQRRAANAPTTAIRTVDASLTAPGPPPLHIPPGLEESPPPPPPPPPFPAPAMVVPAAGPPAPPMASVPSPAPVTTVPQATAAIPPAATASPGGAVLVFDRNSASAAGSPPGDLAATVAQGAPSTEAGLATTSGGRARSTRLGQLASTVPQGTLIPAVLETALDSTRPGYVRALVSRDVRGFDGSRVLVPRGSRLFGEYRADLAPGQNRAFVRWTRLVRPDGVAINLDSPAADALGRAGVQGRVDTHFIERFGQALLRTTVSVGAALAGRSIGDNGVVVALPGAVQTATAPATGQQIQPTLTVDAGVGVTVFVAQDLTFPAVERRR